MGEFYGGGFDTIAPTFGLLAVVVLRFVCFLNRRILYAVQQVAVFGILAHDFTPFLPSCVPLSHGTAVYFSGWTITRRGYILTYRILACKYEILHKMLL